MIEFKSNLIYFSKIKFEFLCMDFIFNELKLRFFCIYLPLNNFKILKKVVTNMIDLNTLFHFLYNLDDFNLPHAV